MGNSSVQITAAIGGVVAIVIALVIYPRLQSAADSYYLEYVQRCEVKGEPFLRTYVENPDSAGEIGPLIGDVVEDSGACSVAEQTGVQLNGADIATSSYNVLSEHGVKVTTVTVATAGTVPAQTFGTTDKWLPPLSVLAAYGGISRLILSILPILAVTGFLGISASNIFSYVRGSSGIQSVVVSSISGLVITMVGIYLAPTIMGFLNDVYLTSSDGRLEIMQQFQAIISLVLGFTPVIYNTGLLAMFAFQGFKAYQDIRSARSGGGGMGAM